jgi:hypothetical protein
VQADNIESIFNKIITEDFLSLEKEIVTRYHRLLGFQIDEIRKEHPYLIL